MDVQRIIGHMFGADTKTPVAVRNGTLKAASTKAEAYKEYGNRDRDGRDDLLLRGKSNNNYYVLSADRIDLSSVGVGNKVTVDGMEATVVEINHETGIQVPGEAGSRVEMTRAEKDGWFSTVQKAVKMVGAEILTITGKDDRAALDNRVYRDGKDNLVIQDDNSKNLYLVTADEIDFTTVGVGDRVQFGNASGKVVRIDDETPRRPQPPRI